MCESERNRKVFFFLFKLSLCWLYCSLCVQEIVGRWTKCAQNKCEYLEKRRYSRESYSSALFCINKFRIIYDSYAHITRTYPHHLLLPSVVFLSHATYVSQNSICAHFLIFSTRVDRTKLLDFKALVIIYDSTLCS